MNQRRQLGSVLQRNLVQTREGGGDCLEVWGWVIEVKRQERLCLPAWWRQACRQAEGKGEPMLLWRQSRKPWRARWGTKGQEGNIAEAANAIREKESMRP